MHKKVHFEVTLTYFHLFLVKIEKTHLWQIEYQIRHQELNFQQNQKKRFPYFPQGFLNHIQGKKKYISWFGYFGTYLVILPTQANPQFKIHLGSWCLFLHSNKKLTFWDHFWSSTWICSICSKEPTFKVWSALGQYQLIY